MYHFDELAAFAAVVRARSFTRAAAQLGVSQSALSQTVQSLERKLDLKLLNRTTRSVSPTEAGERLYQTVGPRLADIEAELTVLGELRGKPAGTVRITATDALWQRERLDGLIRDADSRLGGLLFLYDANGQRHIVSVSTAIIPTFN